MADLQTTYLGLQLKNPLIVSSSSLSSNIDGIQKAAESGAGAIVLKSLFEEQIQAETDEFDPESGMHAEAYDYIQQSGMSHGAAAYLDLIKQAKAKVSIPVIASINCVTTTWWKEFAGQIAQAGADALEINIARMPQNFGETSEEIEDSLVKTVETVRASTGLKLAIKLGSSFTSLPRLSKRLAQAGADALVLFNRFYQFDFELSSGKPKGRVSLSSPDEYHNSLRWTSILFDRCGCELSASTGVHNAETALKLIAAGASTVQVCSVIYRSNLAAVGTMVEEMGKLLDTMGIASVADLRGKYSQKDSDQPEAYERVQYVKALTGVQ